MANAPPLEEYDAPTSRVTGAAPASGLAAGGGGRRVLALVVVIIGFAIARGAPGGGFHLKQLRHHAEPHRQGAAEDFVGRLLDRAGEVLADPLADEVVGDGDLQAVLPQVHSC